MPDRWLQQLSIQYTYTMTTFMFLNTSVIILHSRFNP